MYIGIMLVKGKRAFDPLTVKEKENGKNTTKELTIINVGYIIYSTLSI